MVLLRHQRSTAQLAALKSGALDVALVRDRPADALLDSVLAVEEAMGVVLPSAIAEPVAGQDGVRLHTLSGMSWVGFARGDAPIWYDQVVATLRGHGINGVTTASEEDSPVPREVKLTAVTGPARSFALASPRWVQPLPPGLTWYPLVGNPVIRHTWAAWHTDSERRDLATFVSALDISAG